jgi:pimeloyl-ACP methyl ester carboxylesterase
MLAVSAMLPSHPGSHPPIVLVHGAANSASVWTLWQRELAAHGWASYAIDLRGHGRSERIDLSRTSMHDYAADVCALARQFKPPPVVLGWSMGGLVALMVAAAGLASAVVALAPSMPARQRDPAVEVRAGEFGPEEYGILHHDPEEQRTMPDLGREERLIALASLGRESRLAKDERSAGIVVETLPCPLLLVTGTADRAWPAERYQDLWLKADNLSVEGASHWGLVLSQRALATLTPAVSRWLTGALQIRPLGGGNRWEGTRAAPAPHPGPSP